MGGEKGIGRGVVAKVAGEGAVGGEVDDRLLRFCVRASFNDSSSRKKTKRAPSKTVRSSAVGGFVPWVMP